MKSSESFRSVYRSSRGDSQQLRITELSKTLSQEEWQSVIERKTSMFDDYGPWRIYNSLFYEKGIKDEIRGKVWCLLLEVNLLKTKFVESFY